MGAFWKHSNGLSFSSEGNVGSSVADFLGGVGVGNFTESITLSKLAELFKLNRVVFIKCDREGAEDVIFRD